MRLALCGWMLVGLFAVSCGGSSETVPGGAGTGGSGASAGAGGGTSGSGGGVSGSGGGVAGSGGGIAGSGGTAGTGGGPAGTGGGTMPAPECTSGDQCSLFSDCCTCQALAPGDPQPVPCPVDCLIDKCTELGLPQPQQPTCVAGECIVGFDCTSPTVCPMPEPDCPAGEVASMVEQCWGVCVPVAQCAEVRDCSVCNRPEHVCVENRAQLVSAHCMEVPLACVTDRSCACLGAKACSGIFSMCFDVAAPNQIACDCPNC